MAQSIAEREDLKREPSIFSRESRRLRVLRFFASESASSTSELKAAKQLLIEDRSKASPNGGGVN